MSSVPGRIIFQATPGPVDISIAAVSNLISMTLVRADQENLLASGKTFNPDYTATEGNFGVKRLMDWYDVNNGQGVTDWAKRTKINGPSWTPPVPFEVMKLFSDELIAAGKNGDLWINVPAKYTDASVAALATYFRDNLNPTAKLRVEHSNEIWNLLFVQQQYCQAKADAQFGGGNSVPHGDQKWRGYRTAQILNIFKDVYGASAFSSSVVGVVGAFIGFGPAAVAALFDGWAAAGVGAPVTLA